MSAPFSIQQIVVFEGEKWLNRHDLAMDIICDKNPDNFYPNLVFLG